MPKIVEVQVYAFEELSTKAQARAIDDQRRMESENFDIEYISDDFTEICKCLGITLKTHAVKLLGGATRHDPSIWWQLHSQGAGACFEGSYSYRKGSVAALKAHAPQDAALHRIAEELAEAQRPYAYQLSATVRGDLHRTTIDVYDDRTGNEAAGETRVRVAEALKDLCTWLYKQIDAEYDYRTSDEAIKERLEGDDQMYTENGTRKVYI